MTDKPDAKLTWNINYECPGSSLTWVKNLPFIS